MGGSRISTLEGHQAIEVEPCQIGGAHFDSLAMVTVSGDDVTVTRDWRHEITLLLSAEFVDALIAALQEHRPVENASKLFRQ